jgi:two-component system response regulator AtoC
MTTPPLANDGTSPPALIRVLIVQGEPQVRDALEQSFVARGFSVFTVRDGRHALDVMRLEPYDVALLDLGEAVGDGLDVLRQMRKDPAPPEVIVLTEHDTIETALAALRLGAYDCVSTPARPAELEELVRRAWEKRVLARENVRWQMLEARRARRDGAPAFITQFAPLQAVVSLAERVASSRSPLLISGESGTGKALVGRLLHHESGRTQAPWVVLDCAVPGAQGVETELFGQERAGSVGAAQQTPGLLELASGGTLYLANVEHLDLRVQAALLRALESGRVARLGGTHTFDVDVRIVAATTRDVTRLVASGQFHEGLLQHLAAIRLQLPPLRERRVDVPLLAEHFLTRFGGSAPPRLSAAAVAALEQYRWPGNVRELRTVMERAVLLAAGGLIDAHDLPVAVGGVIEPHDLPVAAGGVGDPYHLRHPPAGGGAEPPTATLTLAALERRHIAWALQRTGWHQGQASALLGISAKTLYRKIREYGFRRPERRGEGGA